MGTIALVVAVLVLIGAVVLGGMVLGGSSSLGVPGGSPSMKHNMRAIVQAQRQDQRDNRASDKKSRGLFETAEQSNVEKNADSRLTLEKRLKYAQWKLPPILFRVFSVVISIFVFGFVTIIAEINIVLQFMCLTSGPLFMGWLLNTSMDRRFKAFDSDYPQFLLSLVGLLKTGMNPMGAIEASAHGLEEGSVIKGEIELMLERLRYGVPEEASIGSFAEDVFHPEIELFVQALLLSRRVGGTLSDTLDRLARQVRKRQYFRKQAVAAVGMQRGSIWFIIGIMVALETYLYFMYPAAVVGAIQDPTGWQVWQTAVALILFGIFWVRQVTKIRV